MMFKLVLEKAEEEGVDRGWDGWMASRTEWTWVGANSRRWWRTGKPGVLQSMGLQRATEQQQKVPVVQLQEIIALPRSHKLSWELTENHSSFHEKESYPTPGTQSWLLRRMGTKPSTKKQHQLSHLFSKVLTDTLCPRRTAAHFADQEEEIQCWHHMGKAPCKQLWLQEMGIFPLLKGCTQYASKFGKLSSGHRTGKGQFSFQSQRKAMPKNAQTTAQLHASHMLVK